MRRNRFSESFLPATGPSLGFRSLNSFISSWRLVITADSFMAIASFIPTTCLKRADGTRMTTLSASAVTVALTLSPVTSEISPKKSPAPSRAMTWPSLMTFAAPE